MQWGNASREVAVGLPLRPGQKVLEVGFGPACCWPRSPPGRRHPYWWVWTRHR
jgi:hypothetical protein